VLFGHVLLLEKKYNFIVSVSHEKEFAIGIVIAEKI